MSSRKSYLAVFLLYGLLAIIFTWPLVTNIKTHGFGYDEDSAYHIWHNWWLKYSLFDLKQNPLQTDYVFHPQKVNLIYDANAFVFSTLTLPIQFLTNNVVLASNTIFILSFALSGLFAFLLAKHLTLNTFPAFIVGFIFAFNPYTTAQGIDGHTNLTTTWIIPLYTLFLLKTLNENRPQSKFSIFNFQFSTAAAGIVAALQLYNDFTYTAFLVIETGLVFLFHLLKAKPLFPTLKRLFVVGATISLVTVLLSWALLAEILKASRIGFRPGSPLWVQNVWSADLLTFIRPNDQTTFLKNPWTPNIGTVEGSAFVGYSVLIVLVIYLLKRFWNWWMIGKPLEKSSENLSSSFAKAPADRRQRSNTESLMIFLAISFFLLMLGPSLHYQNNFKFQISNFKFIFPLPYLLLHKIPFIGETQEPTRLFPFFILPVAILTAFALHKLNQKLSNARVSLILNSLFFILVAIEYISFPFPSTDLSGKPIFDIIQNDPEKKAVLILPLGFNSGNYVLGQSPIGSLQFYQVYHQKPSFRATVARIPYSYFEYYQKLPLLPYLIDPSRELETKDRDSKEVRRVFKEQLNIKYIVVMPEKYKKSLGQTYGVLENILGAQKFYDEEGVRGYLLNRN